MFPGSVGASLAGPTTAAQTSVPSVLASYDTTEFSSTLTGRNSPFQSKP